MAVAVDVAIHVEMTTVISHCESVPILLYRHYSPNQLISRTMGPIKRTLSVHCDLISIPSGITHLELPEQALIQLVTGQLNYQKVCLLSNTSLMRGMYYE